MAHGAIVVPITCACPHAARFKPGDGVVSFVGFGGFATDVVAREGSVAPLPPGMDFFTASCLFVAYGTADYALRVREKQAATE